MRFIRYIPFLLLIVAASVVLPIGVKVAHANFISEFFFDLAGGLLEGIAFLAAYVVKIVVWYPSTWLVWFAGQAFDIVMPYSLGLAGGAESAGGNIYQSDFITEGWAVVRDVTNIGFIFGMLYISFATILRIAGHNARALLVWLVIIAVLVNFSLFFSQIVIDASNILALEFYEALTSAVTPESGTGDNTSASISAVFMEGFNPQSLVSQGSFEAWINQGDKNHALLLLLYSIASAINLFAAYILLLAALIFIGRIAMLWILMILAPAAFVAFIFPQTKTRFWQWWNQLLSQAFLAPVFLFFYFLIAKLIQSAFFESISDQAQVATFDSNAAAVVFFGQMLNVALPFLVLSVFMAVAMKTTLSMSGVVAQYATRAADAISGQITGRYTGMLRYGAGRARQAAARRSTEAIRGFRKPKDEPQTAFARIGRTLRNMPSTLREKAGLEAPRTTARTAALARGAGRATERTGLTRAAGAARRAAGAAARATGLAEAPVRAEEAIAGIARGDIANEKSRIANFSPENLKRLHESTSNPAVRAAVVEQLGEKKDVIPDAEVGFTAAQIKKTLGLLETLGRDTKKLQKLRWQFTTPAELRNNPQLRKDVVSGIDADDVGTMASDQKERFNDYFDAKNNPEIVEEVLRNFGKKHFENLAEAAGDIARTNKKNIFGHLEEQAKKFGGIQQYMERIGNRRAKQFFGSRDGQNLISAWMPLSESQQERTQTRQEPPGGEASDIFGEGF